MQSCLRLEGEHGARVLPSLLTLDDKEKTTVALSPHCCSLQRGEVSGFLAVETFYCQIPHIVGLKMNPRDLYRCSNTGISLSPTIFMSEGLDIR